MGSTRSRRLRFLESLRRAISEKLHDRARRVGPRSTGCERPESTSAIYAAAMREFPDLLEQLLCVHQRARQELGELGPKAPPATQLSDLERKRMLSAVRAAVLRSQMRVGA